MKKKKSVVPSTWGNKDKWVWSDGRCGKPNGSLRSSLVEWVRAPNSLFSLPETFFRNVVNFDPGKPLNSYI